MSSELKKRVLTGAIGGAILLGVTLGLGTIGTVCVSLVLSLAMMHEFLSMVLVSDDRVRKRQILMGIVWLMGFFSAVFPKVQFELVVASFLGIFFYFLIIAYRHSQGPQALEQHFREMVYGFFGVVYLGLLPVFLPLIRDHSDGAKWLLVFFLINWVGDSVAYFVGSRFGKRKLYPAISPKKSWEGTYGGLAGSVLVTLGFKFVAFRSMPWAFVVIAPFLVGISAQMGDLCESFLKRSFQKKDSGALLPGHGGVLDRFDGVVISAPVMYLCICVLG
ncbi:MAG: phosphatidate cytidylyltransferase [Bdellovibrionales bacterium]|nr:phosphatidate cytidylyltransferase [Bdellovibrionales bacterium]